MWAQSPQGGQQAQASQPAASYESHWAQPDAQAVGRGALPPCTPKRASGAPANTAARQASSLAIRCQDSWGTLKISLLGVTAKKKGKVRRGMEAREAGLTTTSHI